jgi:hypothetical protein
MASQTKQMLAVLFFVAGLSFGLTSEAALYDRGNGLIYDDVLNVTWLQDANFFKTQLNQGNSLSDIIKVGAVADSYYGTRTINSSDFDTQTGAMTWWGARAWVASLNQNVYLGFDNWRLPKVSYPSWSINSNYPLGDGMTGYDVSPQSSELGYMYYVNLNNVSSNSSSGTPNSLWTGIPNSNFNDATTAKLTSINNLVSNVYTTGSELEINGNLPGYLYLWTFSMNSGVQTNYYMKAVQIYAWAVRDGDVAAVPLPGAAWLFISGLFGIRVLAKRAHLKT